MKLKLNSISYSTKPPYKEYKVTEENDNEGEWTRSGYQDYLNDLADLCEDEITLPINLENIIDTTFLRALGVIKDEADIVDYHIDGQSLVRLTIKFKKGKNPDQGLRKRIVEEGLKRYDEDTVKELETIGKSRIKKEDITSKKYG